MTSETITLPARQTSKGGRRPQPVPTNTPMQAILPNVGTGGSRAQPAPRTKPQPRFATPGHPGPEDYEAKENTPPRKRLTHTRPKEAAQLFDDPPEEGDSQDSIYGKEPEANPPVYNNGARGEQLKANYYGLISDEEDFQPEDGTGGAEGDEEDGGGDVDDGAGRECTLVHTAMD